MVNPRNMLIILLLIVVSLISCKPNTSDNPQKSAAKTEIPFELVRNVIRLPVTIGDSREFKVILDTGMPFEGLLLYSKE